ncbi:MAG: sulfotransferase [Zoogloeaceae bacterium]|nr:sulfotransferase [Zoogloeaceae bacterium]
MSVAKMLEKWTWRLATLRTMGRALSRQPGLLARRPTYLFVLSHMRSNTSLLSHLLGSHPEISGHSEMGISYRHALDLLKLRCKVFLDSDGLDGTYVLDKILHDDLLIRDPILARPDLRLIFLVRDPVQTLRSILHMGSRERTAPQWTQEPSEVTDYYCARLSRLESYLGRLDPASRDRRALFMCAEDLLAAPEAELARLSTWLDLSVPLSPEYRVFETTGQPGYGDPVGPIKAGRIVAQPSSYHHITLDPALEARARAAYDHFLAKWSEPETTRREGADGTPPPRLTQQPAVQGYS